MATMPAAAAALIKSLLLATATQLLLGVPSVAATAASQGPLVGLGAPADNKQGVTTAVLDMVQALKLQCKVEL